jgi:hypothetical protein
MHSSAEGFASEQARGVRLLHLILLGAGLLVAVVFLIMVRLRGPILVPDAGTPVIAYSFAGIALTAVSFAVLLVRRRIPERASSEGPTISGAMAPCAAVRSCSGSFARTPGSYPAPASSLPGTWPHL